MGDKHSSDCTEQEFGDGSYQPQQDPNVSHRARGQHHQEYVLGTLCWTHSRA